MCDYLHYCLSEDLLFIITPLYISLVSSVFIAAGQFVFMMCYWQLSHCLLQFKSLLNIIIYTRVSLMNITLYLLWI